MCVKQPLKEAFMAICLTLASLLGLLAMPTIALADSGQQADGLLEQRVLAFLDSHTRDLGQDVSIRLHQGSARLPHCDNPTPFLTRPDQRLYGRVSIGVRCGAQGQEVRYLQADVSVTVQHVVAAHDIAVGSMIDSDDLTLEEARLERLPRHALLEIDEAVGLLAARTLREGTTVQQHHLRQESLVKRGERVTVLAQGSGFKVSREATALDNGALGEVVRLRSGSGRGQQLEARVVGHGKLEVTF